MSEQEANPQDEGIEIPDDPAAAFAAVLDTLGVDPSTEEGPENGSEDSTPSAGDLAPAPGTQGAGAEAGRADSPGEGDAAAGAVGGDAPAEHAAAAEPTGFDAAELTPKWGEIITGIETRQQKDLEQEALSEVREKHAKYFEALNQHPRELAGSTVPNPRTGEDEVLRDSQDARDWQEAIKQSLYREVQDIAGRKKDDLRPMMEVIHNSVALFRDNQDLIPGSKQFDKELATEFAVLAKPYELRVEGKLSGYTIPVGPLVETLRAKLATQRAAKPAAPATPAQPTPQQQRAAEQTRNDVGQFHNPDAPQAGIVSRAGSASTDTEEDFSTLFGALGLPNLKI